MLILNTKRGQYFTEYVTAECREREGGRGVYHCNRPTGVQLPLVWAVIIIMIIIIIIIIIKIIITIMSYKKQWQRSHEKLMGKYLKGHIVNLFLAMSLSLSLSLSVSFLSIYLHVPRGLNNATGPPIHCVFKHARMSGKCWWSNILH